MSVFKGTYALTSIHGRYISCDSNEDRAPRADETECRSEEIWRLYFNPNNTLSFQGHVKRDRWRFLCAEGNRADVRCNRENIAEWEQFTPTMYELSPDGQSVRMRLRTHHGTFISAAPPSHNKPHVYQTTNQGDWEIITMTVRTKEDRGFWDGIADIFNGQQIQVGVPIPQ